MSRGPGILTAPLFGCEAVRVCLDDAALVAAMLRFEAALAAAEADLGMIPSRAAVAIAGLAAGDIFTEALAEGTRLAGVPVPALVAAMKAGLEAEDAGFVHWGATSQDVLDTGVCLCFSAAFDVLQGLLAQVIDALQAASAENREVLMVARTRGQLATPISFGQRIAQWAQPLIALESEAAEVRRAALRVQFGGASGSRSVVGAHGAAISSAMAAALGLADSAPWHTDRNGFLRLAGWLGRVVAALGKTGADLAILSRGEVAEVSAGVGGGSSTMPHKSNPIAAETLQSLAVLAAGYEAGLRAAAVHAEERDGVMWPVEWELLPALFETAGAALEGAARLVPTIRADAHAMRQRIAEWPEVLAEAAVFALAGKIGRAEAQRIVTEALGAPEPFLGALAARVDFDVGGVVDAANFTGPSGAVIDQIFAMRRKA